MTDSAPETRRKLINVLNETFAASGNTVKDITDQQISYLIEACALVKQSKGNVPPPPPPPLPLSETQFSFSGFNKPMGDALNSQLLNLRKTTKNEEKTEAKKLPNATKRNKGQDLLTQELKQAIKRKISKAEEKGSKKQKITTVSEVQDPSVLSIKDRFKLWEKG